MTEIEKPLISVIVPVYNVENYMRQCVDSLLNQTVSNIEIILVDDGATDTSPKICDLSFICFVCIYFIHNRQHGKLHKLSNGTISNYNIYFLLLR